MKYLRTVRRLLLSTLLFVSVLSCLAQECRSATADEKKVLEKMINTLKKQLESPLLQDGWVAGSEKTPLPNPQIAKNPGPVRPLMSCSFVFDVQLKADPNSDRGKMLADSAKYYSDLGTTEGAQKMFAVLGRSEINIHAVENVPYLNIHVSPSAKTKKLIVPGVAIVLQSSDTNNSPDQEDVEFYFGNWDNAKVTSGNDAYNTLYPFHHPISTPYVVNMMVHLKGSAQVIEPILKKINWKKLNEALTP